MQRFYRYLPILLIVFFSLLACQKLFTNQFYTSHDGEGHIIRMVEFDAALKDGQFPVRIAKHINHGLGYPFFNFNYPLIYYMGATIHMTGLSYVLSFHLFLMSTVLLGGIGIYFFLKKHFDIYGALMGAIFYILVPYRFLNMYVRGNIAESMALALLPFLFLCIDTLFSKNKNRYIFFSLIVSLLILSHNITAMLSLFFGSLYFLIKVCSFENKKTLVIQTLSALFFSLLLTAFFWVPVFWESTLTRLSELMSDYAEFFPTLKEIIYSPWGFGGYTMGESAGKMSPQIGLLQQAVVSITTGILLWKITRKKHGAFPEVLVTFSLFLFLLSVFLMLPISKFLWDSFPPLQLVQLPWRFLGYTSFAAAICGGYVLFNVSTKKYKIFFLCLFSLVLIYTNRNHIQVNQYVAFSNPFTKDVPYGPSTTSNDEHMPLWAPRIYTTPPQQGEFFPPQAGTSTRILWKSNHHVFTVIATGDGEFRDNTTYYPGWKATIDGKETRLLSDPYGRLRVAVPIGKHTVVFFFQETWYRLSADILSLLAFLGLLYWWIRIRRI